ncbi:hypothetical protein PAPYR_8364 [Paratrimastix pyriformis]|uniref:Uncharacterized protein n=1 Tax=Paratrimastix pyriformis TaxID=342808 RepID=A0ABQ8UAR9_9EUKA|nr:hypothetical protein PAPYR_8364 [Paratrimastix pyriformis]
MLYLTLSPLLRAPPPIAATVEAVTLASQEMKRTRRRPKEIFNSVSPLMRAVLAQPASGGARFLLSQTRLANATMQAAELAAAYPGSMSQRNSGCTARSQPPNASTRSPHGRSRGGLSTGGGGLAASPANSARVGATAGVGSTSPSPTRTSPHHQQHQHVSSGAEAGATATMTPIERFQSHLDDDTRLRLFQLAQQKEAGDYAPSVAPSEGKRSIGTAGTRAGTSPSIQPPPRLTSLQKLHMKFAQMEVTAGPDSPLPSATVSGYITLLRRTVDSAGVLPSRSPVGYGHRNVERATRWVSLCPNKYVAVQASPRA